MGPINIIGKVEFNFYDYFREKKLLLAGGVGLNLHKNIVIEIMLGHDVLGNDKGCKVSIGGFYRNDRMKAGLYGGGYNGLNLYEKVTKREGKIAKYELINYSTKTAVYEKLVYNNGNYIIEKWFYKNGEQKREIAFQNGKPYYEYLFDEKGNKKSRAEFDKNGNKISIEFLDKHGIEHDMIDNFRHQKGKKTDINTLYDLSQEISNIIINEFKNLQDNISLSLNSPYTTLFRKILAFFSYLDDDKKYKEITKPLIEQIILHLINNVKYYSEEMENCRTKSDCSNLVSLYSNQFIDNTLFIKYFTEYVKSNAEMKEDLIEATESFKKEFLVYKKNYPDIYLVNECNNMRNIDNLFSPIFDDSNASKEIKEILILYNHRKAEAEKNEKVLVTEQGEAGEQALVTKEATKQKLTDADTVINVYREPEEKNLAAKLKKKDTTYGPNGKDSSGSNGENYFSGVDPVDNKSGATTNTGISNGTGDAGVPALMAAKLKDTVSTDGSNEEDCLELINNDSDQESNYEKEYEDEARLEWFDEKIEPNLLKFNSMNVEYTKKMVEELRKIFEYPDNKCVKSTDNNGVEEWRDENQKLRAKIYFNAKGKKTREELFDENQKLRAKIYLNDKGKYAKIELFDQDGNKKYKFEYEYYDNNNNNLKKELVYENGNKWAEIWFYENGEKEKKTLFYENGNKSVEILFYKNGNLKSKKDFDCTTGNPTKLTCYDANRKLIGSLKYQEENGKKSAKWEDRNGIPIGKFEYQDKNGKKSAEFFDLFKILKRRLSFDDNTGKAISMEVLNEDGKKEKYIFNYHHENGYPESIECYDKYNILQKKYNFDANGAYTNTDKYGKNGEPIGKTTDATCAMIMFNELIIFNSLFQ